MYSHHSGVITGGTGKSPKSCKEDGGGGEGVLAVYIPSLLREV